MSKSAKEHIIATLLTAVLFGWACSPAAAAVHIEGQVQGGGYRAGGKAMFDSEGNLWVGDNFTIGWQAHDILWQGNATKFAPDGKPLSPITTGFAGGGMQGGTLGPPSMRTTMPGYQATAVSRFGVRQDREAPYAAGGHHVRRQARADAGHHRHAGR